MTTFPILSPARTICVLGLLLSSVLPHAGASLVKIPSSKNAPTAPRPIGDDFRMFEMNSPGLQLETEEDNPNQLELVQLSRDLQALLHLQSFDSALNRVNRMIELAPTNHNFQILRAWILIQLKDYPEADKAVSSIFKQALGLVEKQKQLLYDIQGLSQLMQGKSDQAMATYEKALTVSDAPATLQIRIAWIALYKGNPEKAEEFLKAALASNPENKAARDLYGLAAYRKGDFKRSAREHKASLDLDDQQPAVWNHLGSAQFELGDKEAAVASYKKALELKPMFRDARSNLGGALAAIGKTDEAFEELSLSLDLEITDQIAWRNLLLLVYQQHGEIPKVTNAVQTLTTNLNQAAVHEFLAKVLISTNSIAPAYVFCRSSHLLDPSDIDSLGVLRAVLTRNQTSREIKPLQMRWIKRAKENPTNSLYQAECSIMYDAQGDADNALASMERAVEIQPANPAYRFEMARLLHANGRATDALGQLEVILQTFPDNHVALHRYAWMLMKIPMASQEQHTRALQVVNRANQLTDYSIRDYLQTQLEAFNLLGVDQGLDQLNALRTQFLAEKEKANKEQEAP